MNFKNKRIVIMGLGSYKDGSGISAALYFLKKGSKLLITDLKTKKELGSQLKRLARTGLAGELQGRSLQNIRYVLGKHRKRDFRNADFVFKNPSVPSDSPYLKIARQRKIPIINDWTIYFQERPNNLLIGITGTKGKSTTATLIYQILKAAGKDAVLCGNIGQSPLAILNKIKKPHCIQKFRSSNLLTMQNHAKIVNGTVIVNGTIVVAELSSWLLHDFQQSPQIAVITNLMPDHLDKYKNVNEYFRDKENIFRFQKPNDYLILNKDDKNLKRLAYRSFSEDGVVSRIIWFQGEQKNAAIAVAKLLKIPPKIIKKVIKNFRGLAGRMELIREKNGIKYYNDTAATTPDAAIYALQTLKKYKDKIILIAGGVDKKLDYKNLAKEILKYCKALILFEGTASKKIIENLKIENSLEIGNLKLEIKKDISSMKQAVMTANKYAAKGNIVLLSPAAASFNLFKNEFDRGDQFNKLVKQL